MTVFALDTNIVSYFLKGNHSVFRQYRQEIRYGNNIVIPPLVYYEVKRWLWLNKSGNKLKQFEDLCNEFSIGTMTLEVWDEASRIYAIRIKQGEPISEIDLFIAAFCVINDYVLVTHNTKDFAGIEGLRVVDWV